MNIRILWLITFFVLLTTTLHAQNLIRSPKGYSPQVGAIVSMLDDLKKRVTNSVRNLSQQQTDFLLDEDANRIGALILHLAATEKYYQVYSFQNRGYNCAEKLKWDIPMNLGKKVQITLQGKPISYYLMYLKIIEIQALCSLKEVG